VKRIVTQNLSITILSKLIAFASFLYITRVFTTTDYGIYIYILMILSVLPLFQFGSMHGAVILFPKYIADKNKDEKSLFEIYNVFSHLLQILTVIILFFLEIQLSIYILVVIGLNYVLSKHIENANIFLNADLKFEKSNIIKAIDQVLKPLLILFLFYKYQNIESIFIAQLSVTMLAFIISMYFVEFKFKNLNSVDMTKTLKTIYKVGFLVYLVWVMDILFRTADRWFISQFYSLDELATYGFTSTLAMNIWLLSMSFFAPYVQLLYKNVAEGKYVEVKKIVESTNKKLYTLLAIVSIMAVIAYPYLLEFIVKKYFDTYFLFFILVMVSILLTINNIYVYYMISNDLNYKLLKYQSVILIINLILNGIFSYYHLEILYFGYSTILSLMIYYILVRRYFYIDIKIKI
jgi:O-antigen/teichoic acid export membrane protein